MDLLEIVLHMLIGLVTGLLIYGCYSIVIATRNKFLNYETFEANVKVVDKEYEDEEFNVTVTYDGRNYYFDNEDLFNSVEVGDIISAQIHIGYNKNEIAKHTHVTICTVGESNDEDENNED